MALIACCITLVCANSHATVFAKINLQHREASDVKTTVAPLLSEGMAIIADDKSVVISGSAAQVNSLRQVIRSMDKAKKSLKVSVFRGEYPSKKGVVSFSTHRSLNRQQIVQTEEGQTIVITDHNVVKIEVANSTYKNNSDVVDDDIAAATAAQITTSDGVLAIVDETADDTLTDDDVVNELGIVEIPSTGNAANGETGTSQRSELMEVPTGLHLRVTLMNQRQARVAVKSVSINQKLADGDSGSLLASSQDSSGNATANQVIALSTSTETLSTVTLNQWTQLSDDQTFTHPPELSTQRKVHSTQSSEDQQASLWVKVEVM